MTNRSLAFQLLTFPARWLSDKSPDAIPPLHPQGHALVGLSLWLALLAMFISTTLTILLCLVGIAFYAFFRFPSRTPPEDPDAILSPSDGTVSHVRQITKTSTDRQSNEPYWEISVFLSVFDAHIIRSPVESSVHNVIWQPGLYLDARHQSSLNDNTRCTVQLLVSQHSNNSDSSSSNKTSTIDVSLIAGRIARRIVPFINNGQSLKHAQPLGFIRFGSRVTTHMPISYTPQVSQGQRLIGGETILARADSSSSHP